MWTVSLGLTFRGDRIIRVGPVAIRLTIAPHCFRLIA